MDIRHRCSSDNNCNDTEYHNITACTRSVSTATPAPHTPFTHAHSLSRSLSRSPIKTAITHPFPHTTRHSLCNTHTHTHTHIYIYVYIYVFTYPLSPRMMIFKSVLFLAADMTAHSSQLFAPPLSLCSLSLCGAGDVFKIQQERE